ncbi:hypothetical protein GCM10010168_32590 [Actinoplanes ianthinogenes]|uniref:Uncharacterized protein n=1 Tax=Actinoplanes ianthinogenes TaxID=122358 RepID=A0ABM7LMB0_9ACTN|nr:hypothetical protein Aiant_10560 [Actinoplanes ianthinogenes]GGR11976.1 hypothetical protein GCM10010168_32590 [Actinoplanes ianthinogenes]
MSRRIGEQPLAQAVLEHLAEKRPGTQDPVGSFARTVLNGEATLSEAAAFSWHAGGLEDAFRQAEEDRKALPAEERAEFDQQASRLREQQSSGQFDGRGHHR